MGQKAKLLRSQLALLKPVIENCPLSTTRKWQEKIGKLMASTHKERVDITDLSANGVPCAMITPRDELSSGVILYLHGGGYVAGSLDYAKGFGSVLSACLGVRVLCVAYRLAPEHPFPAALDDALDAYGYLLSNGFDPRQILLCGESAGGGLCYALCLRLLEKGRTQPAGIVAISPWTDLTMSGASVEGNRMADPSLTPERLKYFADFYLYGAVDEKKLYPKVNPDLAADIERKMNPHVSPIFGDLEGLPPSLIFVGGDEILLDDARCLHEKLTAAGCSSELVIAPEMWHGYILYPMQSQEQEMEKIRKFLKSAVPHQKKLRWMSLDNAAKIFPASRSRQWSNVFRLSATMRESVDLAVLRTALDVTVRRFPSIAVRLRTGVFWYYLEELPKAPDVMEEKAYPLSRMIFDDIRRCAFRVIVYDKRIAIEFFHALTDGNGGLVFLKTLVAEYIYQKYAVKVPVGNGVLDRLEEPTPAELEDSFQRYVGPHKAPRRDTDAYKLRGTREPDGFRTNTTLMMQADEVLREAKKRGITVTAYMTAAMIIAVSRVQDARVEKKKQLPVKIFVPVNLRKMFPSETLRNFILYATPGIDPRLGEYDFEEVCSIVHHQMKLQITEKNMAAMIATNVGDERPLLMRVIPLFLKNIVMKMVFDAVGERKSCFSFSNLGVCNMPEEFTRYVDRMDFVVGVQAHAPYNVGLLTYGGTMYMNLIRNIEEPLLEAALYGVLREQGIHVKAESNARECVGNK